MDLEKIQAYNEQRQLESEKTSDQLLDVALSKGIKNQVDISSRETQLALTRSIGTLLSFLKSHEPSVTVKNQPQFPTSISTPDVAPVINAIKQLNETVSKKETDFSAVTKGLDALDKAVKALPKPNDAISITNQIDYSEDLKSIKESVDALEVSPTVNLPEPKVVINSDFKEVIGELGKLQTAVKSIKFPEVPKTDIEPLLEATNKVQKTIANLSFPAPNYILPFKSTQGAATQVQLTSDGKLPVDAQFSGTIESSPTFKDDPTDTVETPKYGKTNSVTHKQQVEADTGLSQPLTDTQLRATPVPVSGTVSVTGVSTAANQTTGNTSLSSIDTKTPALGQALAAASTPVVLPATQITTLTPQTNALTDTQLRATPVPISGTVTATGPLTDTQLRAVPVPVSGTITATPSGTQDENLKQVNGIAVNVGIGTAGTGTQRVAVSSDSFPATQAVTGTFFQATQPVSGTVTATGPLTDTQLRATPVPVSGTVATGGLTDTQLRATAVPVSLTSTTITGTADVNNKQVNGVAVNIGIGAAGTGTQRVAVSSDSFPATQPVSLASVPTHGVAGDVAHDAVDSGNPVKIGGKVSTSAPTIVSNADRVDGWFDEYGRQVVTDKDPETGQAQGTTSLRDRLVAQRYTVLSDSIADGLAAFWTQTTASGGTIGVTGGEGLLQTSASAGGSAQLSSIILRYHPGQVTWLNSAFRFSTGATGNTRRLGAFTVSGTTPQDGFYFELADSTLNAVVIKAGVVQSSVASTSWSRVVQAPFTLDTNYHSFELRYTANSVNFLVDNVVRHTYSGTSAAITTTLDFPITMQNINSTNATNVVLGIRNIGMGRFGTPPTEYTSGQVLADQTGAAAVQTFTFTIPVDFVWVTDIGATTTNVSRVDPFGGTPAATTGIPVLNGAPTPISVVPASSTVKVYAPSGSTIAMYGLRYT